ncbi:L-threonylcarbamoyladenylate synthase [Burkholderia vietnamiensis]|uniref:L-threonylcarbamoyladenylate synthase n=1 Tax=Burkholderia vietnamiensis TaxID=60552 RepID=UPI001593C4D3|nr:L-threonylcarbamoyladenylate synthase [Burkholderia vietnamiensis]
MTTAPVVSANNEYLEIAVDTLRRGGLLISPTTTNYNILCDATNPDAVARVFEVKRRVKYGPLPVSVPYPDRIPEYVTLRGADDERMLSDLLPGEVSFIYRQRYPFPEKLTCGSATVAVSCTTHPVMRSIVIGLDGPVAATSANISGQGNIFVPLTKALEDVGHLVDLVIDAGPTAAELAGSGDRVNTIVDLTRAMPYVVRKGWVPLERLRPYLPNLVEDVREYEKLNETERSRAPTSS